MPSSSSEWQDLLAQVIVGVSGIFLLVFAVFGALVLWGLMFRPLERRDRDSSRLAESESTHTLHKD